LQVRLYRMYGISLEQQIIHDLIEIERQAADVPVEAHAVASVI
jgi:hypothetical protein